MRRTSSRSGARSFTGATIDGQAEGVPPGDRRLGGIDWLTFLSSDTDMVEPVEIGVQTWGVHNVTETLEVDVFIDAGADGVFADEELQADYLAVKLPQPRWRGLPVRPVAARPVRRMCGAVLPRLQQLQQQPRRGRGERRGHRAVDNANSAFSYRVEACTGTFSGDVPGFVCDHAGEIDDDTETWDLVFDASDPALHIDPLTCQGSGAATACDEATDRRDRRVRRDRRRSDDPRPVPERRTAPVADARRDPDVAGSGGPPRRPGNGLRPFPGRLSSPGDAGQSIRFALLFAIERATSSARIATICAP